MIDHFKNPELLTKDELMTLLRNKEMEALCWKIHAEKPLCYMGFGLLTGVFFFLGVLAGKVM